MKFLKYKTIIILFHFLENHLLIFKNNINCFLNNKKFNNNIFYIIMIYNTKKYYKNMIIKNNLMFKLIHIKLNLF